MSVLLEKRWLNIRKKSKTRTKFTAYVYPTIFFFLRSSAEFLQMTFYSFSPHTTSPRLSHFPQENNESRPTSYCVDKEFTSCPQRPAAATCRAWSFFHATHIDTAMFLWAFSTHLYDATLSSTYKIHPHFKMSKKTSVPLPCLSNVYPLLWEKSLAANLHGSPVCQMSVFSQIIIFFGCLYLTNTSTSLNVSLPALPLKEIKEK